MSALSERCGDSVAEKPELVREAESLMALYQAGKEAECVEAALSCFYGISEVMVAAEIRKDGRLLTFASPQIAQLATRLGWLTDPSKSGNSGKAKTSTD